MNRFLNQCGSTVVDYLMLTAAVAGIAVPIVMKFFGEPIMATFQSQRQTLVSFIAQDRKQPVPNIWFSRERLGITGGENELNEVGELAANEPAQPGDLKEPGNLRNVRRGRAPGRLNVGQIKEPGRLEVGQVSGGGRGGAEGSSFGGAGGGADGGGGSALSGSFFDPKGPGGQGGAGEAGGSTGSRRGYRSGGRGEESDDYSAETSTSSGEKVKKQQEKDDKQSADKGITDSKRQTEEMIAKYEEDRQRRAGAFDWWLILKILIFILIIFLIILIALGNMRKN